MNILIIDDEQPIRESLTIFIRELGHEVFTAADGREGFALLQRHPIHLVFTDIRMPNMDGFEFIRAVKESDRKMVDIVLITGHGQVETAVRALREGAYDYLTKPVNIEELAVIVERVSEHLDLKLTNRELTERFEERVRERVSETESLLERYRTAFRANTGLDRIVIHSRKLGDIFALGEKFHASPSVPVLIEGETGTGKELLARFIHYGPEVDTKPFIALNCAAIPSDLFESELFGHESGAFTGSGSSTKKGQFEAAEDGTVLLDEIGEIPLNMQVKLLRVLEEREFYRVGGIKRTKLRARVIATTNRSLREEVEKGTFRRDLYHRLDVGYIRIPPLRDRPEEILPLSYHFLKLANERHRRTAIRGFSRKAEEYLVSLTWPGNVRQLENAIERLVLVNDNPLIELSDLDFIEGERNHPQAAGTTGIGGAGGRTVLLGRDARGIIPPEGIDLDDLITRLVAEAMVMANGSKTTAAKLLNISPRTITRRLDKLPGN